VELYLHSPSTPSWCGARLKKHRGNFIISLYILYIVLVLFLYFLYLHRREPGYLSAIVLGCGLDDRRFETRQWLGIFLFTTVPRPALGPTQPPIQWVPGALSLGVQRPERETDHSSSAEVKNAWTYTSTPPIRLHVVVLEVQGQLYLYNLDPKVSGLAAWSENCKWYSSLPLGTVVSLFCESV
jgi:hypothetical protein